MPKENWETVGELPVDAGCLLIIDPCYLHSVLGESQQIEDWYDEVVVGNAEQDCTPVPSKDSKCVLSSLGHIVTTGYGDGSYPLQIRKTADGRIAELRVLFIDEQETDS